MISGDFAALFEATRPELLSYVTRLVVRHAIAEEVAVRALSTDAPPPGHEWRPWLFRVATRLALDHRRKHGTWRENMLLEVREAARTDARFTAIFALRGLLRGARSGGRPGYGDAARRTAPPSNRDHAPGPIRRGGRSTWRHLRAVPGQPIET
jgi:hypothetical protein